MTSIFRMKHVVALVLLGLLVFAPCALAGRSKGGGHASHKSGGKSKGKSKGKKGHAKSKPHKAAGKGKGKGKGKVANKGKGKGKGNAHHGKAANKGGKKGGGKVAKKNGKKAGAPGKKNNKGGKAVAGKGGPKNHNPKNPSLAKNNPKKNNPKNPNGVKNNPNKDKPKKDNVAKDKAKDKKLKDKVAKDKAKDKKLKDKVAKDKARDKKLKDKVAKDKAKAHREAERVARERERARRLQHVTAAERRRIEALHHREGELRADLHRLNNRLRNESLRRAGRLGAFNAAIARNDLGRWRIWNRNAYNQLLGWARNHPDAAFRAAVIQANTYAQLSAAQRLALISARDALLYDSTLAAAKRAAYRQALNQALWQDNFLIRQAAYQAALVELIAGATYQPPLGRGPVVVGIDPTAGSFLIPATDGSAPVVIQILPGAPNDAPNQKLSPEDEEARSLIDDGGAVKQTTRYLRLGNATAKPLRVSLAYHTEVANGEPQWFPRLPNKEKNPVNITLKPGEVAYVTAGNWKIHADQVYLWAEADGRKWERFKDEPLLLVPETDADGNHSYEAPVRDVFTYTFK